MGEGLDIPAADLLFVTFQAEGIIYLALLKMNYKESYTHEITEIPDNPVINTDIIKTHSLLPSATSRIPEAVVINLSDYHIKLCLLYTSPSPRDRTRSRMPSSA